MKVTYNWLKQYMDLSDVKPEDLAEILTDGGLEVEGVEKMAYATNLIIGYVKECIPHPDSDHLHVCQVDIGNEVKQIVCGAPNVREGLKVIVALPGCKLPGGEIKSGMIRGQLSDGMICALFELGVDKKNLTEQQLSGVEELPDDAEVGNTNVLEYLKLDDTIYDVHLTPNRADCLSMWSFAKEVGALLNKNVTLPDYSYEVETIPASLTIVSETENCPVFEGKIVNHVTIKPSPAWLKELLNAAGVKSINNVVDISNFVMLETGQPLHFYDLAKVPAREITVKQGLDEIYTALDGVEYQIKPNDIMITTDGNTIGIGGVMGGDDSKIDENTTGIIIEAATFNNVCIRNTSRRLGLDTEAASRFSKGIDPLGGHKSVERSVQLLLELADASGVEETVLCGSNGYQPTVITSSVEKINHLLATNFTFDDIFSVYERLDFQPEKVNDDEIKTTIPSYRTDITRWNDLSEEVIRILGYDCIESTLPLMPTVQGGLSDAQKHKRVIQQMLNGHGISEIITYSLVSKAKIDEGVLPCGTPVELANPISDERKYFRTSLLPSMMDTISYNVARHNTQYGFFEIANVYNNENVEEQHLSIAISQNLVTSQWQGKENKNDFYTMKGIVLSLLAKFGFVEERINFVADNESTTLLHPYQCAKVYINKSLIGKIGVVHPVAQKKYDIDKAVLAELNLTAIYSQKPGKVKFVATPKYPAVTYDLSMLINEKVTAQQICQTVKKAGGKLLKDVTIFDVYHGLNIETALNL